MREKQPPRWSEANGPHCREQGKSVTGTAGNGYLLEGDWGQVWASGTARSARKDHGRLPGTYDAAGSMTRTIRPDHIKLKPET